jgi:hypothetical protein
MADWGPLLCSDPILGVAGVLSQGGEGGDRDSGGGELMLARGPGEEVDWTALPRAHEAVLETLRREERHFPMYVEELGRLRGEVPATYYQRCSLRQRVDWISARLRATVTAYLGEAQPLLAGYRQFMAAATTRISLGQRDRPQAAEHWTWVRKFGDLAGRFGAAHLVPGREGRRASQQSTAAAAADRDREAARECADEPLCPSCLVRTEFVYEGGVRVCCACSTECDVQEGPPAGGSAEGVDFPCPVPTPSSLPPTTPSASSAAGPTPHRPLPGAAGQNQARQRSRPPPMPMSMPTQAHPAQQALSPSGAGSTHHHLQRGSGRYKYERRSHFRDTMNQFQGRQNKTFPPRLFRALEAEFEAHHLVRDDPPPPDATPERRRHHRYGGVTKEHLLHFLSESKFSKYYEDINLLHAHYTGVPCPDISKYEAQLMDDFDRIEAVYARMNIDRENFLNANSTLYQLLRRRGYKCRGSDFSLLKTRDRIVTHDTIMQDIFRHLGWKFYPLV